MIANYHSIDTFSNVDGPGIRYVLFLQGCNMLCKYCHNVDAAQKVKGQEITVEEVINDFLKYSRFYTNGGITISGGEPLMQIDFIIELFKRMKRLNIHTCIETQGSLFINNKKFEELVEYTDLFIVDLKAVDNMNARRIGKIDVEKSLEFLSYLNQFKKEFTITYVLLPGINNSNEILEKLGTILARFDENLMSFQILPYHKFGVEKWEKLNLNYQFSNVQEATEQDVQEAKEKINKSYFNSLSKSDTNGK